MTDCPFATVSGSFCELSPLAAASQSGAVAADGPVDADLMDLDGAIAWLWRDEMPTGASGLREPLKRVSAAALQVKPPPSLDIDALEEPHSVSVEKSCRAQEWHASKWQQVRRSSYHQVLNALMRRENGPNPLLQLIEHLVGLLQTYIGLASAANMRGEREAAAQQQASALQVRGRLLIMAAIVTEAAWPLANKLRVLTLLRASVAGDSPSFREFTCCGDTYLHVAVRSPHTTGVELGHLVQFFLDAGVDPNARDATGSPAAALLGSHEDCLPALSHLLDRGANPNLVDGFGYSVMHRLAAHPQGVVAVPVAQRAGGDALAVTERGETLLHMIPTHGDEANLVRYLLCTGVSAEARDHMGFQASDSAAWLGRRRSLPLLGSSNPHGC